MVSRHRALSKTPRLIREEKGHDRADQSRHPDVRDAADVKSERVEKGVYPSLKQVKSKSDTARRQSRASAAYISICQNHYSSK